MNLLDLMVKVGVDDQASSKVGGIASGITERLGGAVRTAGKVIAGGVAAVGAGAAAMTTAAVKSYASYEQLVGGVDKLYGSASDKLQKYAQDAYRTSGMSANQYMEQATSFSAALITSLGGDVSKAADMTDVAMRAIADNVDTFGSDMESVQMAFQGFAKDNYTMLDNLKLGFAGSKDGAEQLVKAASELTDVQEKLGLTVDADSTSFDNMVAAVAVWQEHLSIAGTTANEAMTTIDGSFRMARTSWENFLTAIGSGDPEMIANAVSGLVDSIFGSFNAEVGKREGGIINNVLPVVRRVGDAIVAELPSIAESMARNLIETFNDTFGTDFDADGIIQSFEDAFGKAQDAVSRFVDAFKSTFKSDEFANAFEHVKSAAGKLFDFVSDNADEFGAALGVAADVFGALADAVATVLDVFGPFIPAIAGVVAGLGALSVVQGVIGAISGAITFFTTVLGPALAMVQSVSGLVALVTTVLGGPLTVIAALAGAVIAFVATNDEAKQMLLDAWNAVVDFFSGIPDWWNGVWEDIKSSVVKYADESVAKWNEMKDKALQLWENLKVMVTDKVLKLVSSVVSKFNELKTNAVNKFNEIRNNISNAVNAAKERAVQAFQQLKDGVNQKISEVVNFVRNLPSRIRSALGNLGSLLWNAGSSIISGLLNGMKSAIGGVFSWVSGIAGNIAMLKGPLPYDRKVLVANGEALMAGLQKGLSIGFEDDVKPYVESMASEMSNAFGVPSVSAKGYEAQQKGGPTFNLTIGSLTVRGRDDAEYFADRINRIWKHEVEGSLA